MKAKELAKILFALEDNEVCISKPYDPYHLERENYHGIIGVRRVNDNTFELLTD